MYLSYKFFKDKKLHVFYISVVVFIFLNLVENFIHYNIGHHPEAKAIVLTPPTYTEWVKIIVVMCVFAFLQGLFTYWMD
jgi:hypothetical protein